MTIRFDNPPKNGPWTFHPVKRRASRRLHRVVGRCRGPKPLKGCKACKFWNPHTEAYACDFCDEKLAREKREGM